MHCHNNFTIRFALLSCVLLLGGCASTAPNGGLRYLDDRMSYDGLTLVEGTTMSSVWVRRNSDIDQYTKIRFASAGIKYTPVKPIARSSLAPMRSNEFPIPKDDREKLEEVLSGSLRENLTQLKNYEITEADGPDVMLVRIGVFDVVSRVPPPKAGRSEVYLDEVGKATLMVEVQDSLSGAVIVRAIDRRAAEPSSEMFRSNTVRNWSEVQQLADFWGSITREGLDSLKSDLESLR